MDDRTRAVLAGLDDAQASAVTAPLGPVRILAGAGTGKTRTITHRIAYQALTGAAPATQVLAVTHSRKAASELRERLAGLGVDRVQARTFHAAALRQLSHFWSATGLPGTRPDILTDRRTLVRTGYAQAAHLHPAAVTSETVLTMDAEITWAHARLVSPKDYQAAAARAGRVTELDAALVAAAYQAYENLKRTRGVLDFDDLLVYCAQLISRNDQVAAAVRGAYTSFVVDEYQDTDPAQQQLLEAWLGPRDAVTVVGDTSQTIYSFRGADPDLLLRFTDRWPGALSVALDRNYRSTPQVLRAANNLAASFPGAVTLQPVHAAGPAPQVRDYPDEDAEVRGIATTVKGHLNAGVPAGQIAVLHRYNSQSPAIRAALAAAGVPVVVRKDDEFFSRREIVAAMRLVAAAAQADPDDDGLVVLAEALDAGGFLENEPPPGVGAARERWENQLALLEQGRSLARTGPVRVGDLVAEMSRRAAAEHVPTSASGVTVTTIHKAKGLEWDVVVLARATDGSLPSALASTSAELVEERRLAYVAVTRARTHLHATWSRTWGSRGAKSTPSPYLSVLGAGPGGSGAGSRRRGPQAPAASKSTLAGLVAGTRVAHDRHGLGTVVAVEAGHLLVDFGTGAPTRVRPGEPVEAL